MRAKFSAGRSCGVLCLESHGFLLDPICNCNRCFAESSICFSSAVGGACAEGNVFLASRLCGTGCVSAVYTGEKCSAFMEFAILSHPPSLGSGDF